MGLLDGRTFQCAILKEPAWERTAADSGASSSLLGGMRLAKRVASMVLPEPGRPTNSMVGQ